MFAHCLNQGWVEVVTGCMFSGKSEELIRRVRRAKFAKQGILVFKHAWDDRYKSRDISSHCGNSIDAIPISTVEEIEDVVKRTIDVKLIAIDEVQFFDESIVNFIEKMAKSGKRVIVAGLDQDFKGEPFKIVMELLAKSELIQKFNAICSVCSAPASRTQRLVNGKPAKASDPIVLVGATNFYEARCRKCHELG